MKKSRLMVSAMAFLACSQFAASQTVPASLAPSESSAPAVEAAAPLSQSIFLDVRDLGNDVSTSTHWKTTWGSYSQSQQRVRALELLLRNPAKVPGEYLIEWYFFASPARGGKRVLHDHDSKTIPLAPGGLERATLISAEYNSHTTRYSSAYYHQSTYKYGSKPDGWAVRVKINGKIIRTKTSGAIIDDILKKAETFEASVTEWRAQHPK